jgi:hypothetical protein
MLDRAAPMVSARTTELQAELQALAVASETCARAPRGRCGLRLGIASGVALGAVGVSAGAGMAGVIPVRRVPWSTTSGTTCQFSTEAVPGAGAVPTSPDSSWPTPKQRRRAVAAANEILAAFDYGSVDVDEAVAQYQELPDQPSLSGDDLELTAVNGYVSGIVDQRLEQQSLDPRGVMYGTEFRCDQ